MRTEKKPVGRPPMSKRRAQLKITLPDDDHEVLKEFCSLTGSVPATYIREIVQQSIPSLKVLLNAARTAKVEGFDRIEGRAAVLLSKALAEQTGVKEEMFNEMLKEK